MKKMFDMHYNVSNRIARDSRFRRSEIELIDEYLARPTSKSLRHQDLVDVPGVNDENLSEIVDEYCLDGVLKKTEERFCPKHKHQRLSPQSDREGLCHKCDCIYSFVNDNCRLEMIYRREKDPDQPYATPGNSSIDLVPGQEGQWWKDWNKTREKITDITLKQIIAAVVRFILNKFWLLLLGMLLGGSSNS